MDSLRFAEEIGAWFRREGRVLSWRETSDPYAILVSEVMLQQTTVAAVKAYFERWMKRFPTLEKLAEADLSDVLTMWQGLGYYRRARNLHAAARKVVLEGNGRLPSDYKELRRLPGVGDYTTNAVLAFAFDKPAPALDANILRVVVRLFDIREPMDRARGRRLARERLEEILPATSGRLFVSGLMELGALICRAGEPECVRCPVRHHCKAKHPETLPNLAPKAAIKRRDEHAAWIGEGDRVLLQGSGGARWHGLWRLPTLEGAQKQTLLARLTYSIVRERVTLRVYPANLRDLRHSDEERRMFSFEETKVLAICSPHRRVIEKVIAQKSVLPCHCGNVCA